jgi:hypothetical protein
MAHLLFRFCRTSVFCLLIAGVGQLCLREELSRLQPVSERAQLETALAEQGVGLLEVREELGNRASLRIAFDAETLAPQALYLRRSQDFVYVDASGIRRAGWQRTIPWETGELVLSRERQTLYVNGRPWPLDLAQWEAFWVTSDEQPPKLAVSDVPAFEMSDGFMRNDLKESKWQIHSGSWSIRTFGGGAPSSDAQLQSINFQRAVNAFALTGQGGVLTYGETERPHAHVEARFFFGAAANDIASLGRLPATDMQVLLGDLAGVQVAFGWVAAESAFLLRTRHADEPWQVLAGQRGARPAVSNWVKIGLELENGHAARALLDGAVIAERRVRAAVRGPFHLAAGVEPVMIDDVRAWNLPTPPTEQTPVYVKSRNFAGKKNKPNSDPVQFGQWARSDDSFVYEATPRKSMTNRLPLFGDFSYESLPEAAESEYVYEILAESATLTLRATRTTQGWQAALADWPEEHREFALRLRRVGELVELRAGEGWLPVGKAAGACKLRIGHEKIQPQPSEHRLQSANLVNEFFEEAPTDWAWIDGRFRMDIRWACQNQWNFMACDSLEVPYMTSKHRFEGDQIHECYLSLRPLIPREIGWYVRRDLTFSFCTDGRNPMSGYTVLLGADDNSESRLLRQGEVVATSDVKVPGGVAIENVHWMWWNFEARKRGNTITIVLNDKTLFEYEDAEPLSGGHVGFWSVRNGFTVSRYTGLAESLGYDPDVLYVRDDAESIWEPLLRDAVQLRHRESEWHTDVLPNVGGGNQAVRLVLDSPLNVATASTLDLPLRLAQSTQVNVFAMIAGQTYVVPVAAPLTKMRSWLPVSANESFQPSYLTNDVIAKRTLNTFTHEDGRLRVNLWRSLGELGVDYTGLKLEEIIVGNCSNADYLMAGGGGRNAAGGGYAVGTPQLLEPPIEGWQVVDWAAPAELEPEPEARLRVHSAPVKDGEKTAIVMPYLGDLSAAERAVIQLENCDATREVGIALAVKTTDAHTYYELPPQVLEPGGKVDLAFDLKAADWKSEETSWEHQTTLAGADEPRELLVLFYHQGKGCELSLDGVVFQ